MKTKSKEGYRVAPWFYDLRGFFILKTSYRASLLHQIRFFAANIRKRHLEVAVGTGTLLYLTLLYNRLRRRRTNDIIGVDLSPEMLNGAKKRFRRNEHIHLVVADASTVNLPEKSFDSINIANAFHCFSNPPDILNNARKWLRDDGTLAVNVLVPPDSTTVRGRLAQRINRWGVSRGLLVRPYTPKEVHEIVSNSGFDVQSESTTGHCMELVLKKRAS